jgi:hypothetical protein
MPVPERASKTASVAAPLSGKACLDLKHFWVESCGVPAVGTGVQVCRLEMPRVGAPSLS